MELKEIFGRTLRELRIEKGLTQERLAELSDLGVIFISRLENGKRQPTLSTIFSLSKALEIEPSFLIGRVEKLKN